jgi:hypothetical protein
MGGTATLSGIEVISRSSLTQAAHRRAGEVVDELNRLNEQADRIFNHLQDAQAKMLQAGSVWNPILPPPIEAAYQAWLQHGPRETRVELTAIGPVPMMEPEP